MRKNMMKTRIAFAALALIASSLQAADVPAQLPDPDGKPGDATKPVKVYILTGQSNMVEIAGFAWFQDHKDIPKSLALLRNGFTQ
jgi:hypothetical protein